MEQNQRAEPKISLPEAIFLIEFALISDLINWIPLLNWIVTLFMLPGFLLYFMLRGVRGYYSLAGNLVELVPVLSALPAITLGVVVTIVADQLVAKASALPVAGGVTRIVNARGGKI